MSGGSDNKEYVEKQFEYDTTVWKYEWDEMNRSASHAMSSYLAETHSNQQIADYEYNAAVNNWQDANAIQDFDYANQMKAYNSSIETYDKQLSYNDLAEEIALNDNKRRRNDRHTEIGFQNEELLMNHDFTQTVKAFETIHALEAGQVKTIRLGKGIKDAFDSATLDSHSLLNQFNAARDEAARKGTDLTLEGLQKQGQVLASGQTGRTTRKNLQTVLSEIGRGQKTLSDMLTKEELGYTLNMEKMAIKLDSLKGDAKIGYNELAVQLAQTADKASMAILQSKIKTGVGQRQLQESLKSADQQYLADVQQIALKKYEGDLGAEANIAPEAVKAPAASQPVKAPEPFTQPPPSAVSWDEYAKIHPLKGAISKSPGLLESIFSDDRLKYDINRVGTSKKGVPIYTFKYRFDGKHGPKYKGTSAQDLLNTKFKDAVGQTENDGFLYVNYSKLDVEFEKIT